MVTKKATKKTGKMAVKTKTAVKKKVQKKSARQAAAKKTVAAKPAPRVVARPIKKTEDKIKSAVIGILDERQAEETAVVDVRGKSALADWIIVASGRNSRHVAALADALSLGLQGIATTAPRVEGLPQGDWVVVDAGDVIIHLFRPEVRRYYDLDSLLAARQPDVVVKGTGKGRRKIPASA